MISRDLRGGTGFKPVLTTLLALVGALSLAAWPMPARAQSDNPHQERTMERRGIHVTLGTKSTLPHVERLLTELAPALGVNWLLLEVDNHFAYQSHPEVAEPDSIGAADAHRLARLARDKGIRLVPEYNCLGHQSFREKPGALLRAHPEFNEAPDMDMDQFQFDNFFSWCPNNPDVYRVVFDLIDELLDAFEADAFHVGMDEVFVLGECPRCKGTPTAQLFAKAVNDLHAHVVGKRGKEMMMWGDRLLPPSTGYSMWERSNNETEGALDLIPQDIVMCDWHYEVMEQDDYPSVRYFQQKGFRVWPGGWNETDAVRRLIEVARRDATDRMIGYLATTWVSIAELVPALSGEQVETENKEVPKVAACVRLASDLWGE